jgi:hypothetical protein
LVLTIMFQRDFGSIWQIIKKSLRQIFLASLVMGGIVYSALNVFDKIFDIRTFVGVFFQGLCAGLLGLIFWFFILYFVKNQELDEIISSLKQKFIKVKPIAPQPETLP